MAKRSTNSEPTKTQLIQDFYNQGITTAKGILEKLEAAGQPSTKSMVYGTISKMKKEQGDGRRTRRGGRQLIAPVTSNGAASVETTRPLAQSSSGGSISLADLAAISDLAKRIGGVEQMRRVLDSLAGLSA